MTFSPKIADSKGFEQNKRLQVELEVENPLEPKIKVRQQTWSEDLGWLTQKTLSLELDQAQTLLLALEQSLKWGKVNRSNAQKQISRSPETGVEQSTLENKIIPFPVKKS
jgi:hypothetical protein